MLFVGNPMFSDMGLFGGKLGMEHCHQLEDLCRDITIRVPCLCQFVAVSCSEQNNCYYSHI